MRRRHHCVQYSEQGKIDQYQWRKDTWVINDSPAYLLDGHAILLSPPLAFIMSRNRVDTHPVEKNKMHTRDTLRIALMNLFMTLKEHLRKTLPRRYKNMDSIDSING